MAKNPIPRLNAHIEHLLNALTRGRTDPWVIWTRINRHVTAHRPAWERAGYQIPDYDFCRALALGVIEARTMPIDSTEAGAPMPLGPQDVETVYNKVGVRIHVRATKLGRAALAAKDLKEAKPKPVVRVVQPILMLPLKPKDGP